MTTGTEKGLLPLELDLQVAMNYLSENQIGFFGRATNALHH